MTLRIVHLKKTIIMKRIIAIAASLMTLAATLWFCNRSPDPAELFARYHQPGAEQQRAQKIIPTLESQGLAGVQTETDTLRDALQFYADGDFAEAEKRLKIYLESNPEDQLAQYFLGATYMSLGNYAKAVEMFSLLSQTESPLKNDALWNLGLCYLKMENGIHEARLAFEKLSADNAFKKRQDAKALLEQLPVQ